MVAAGYSDVTEGISAGRKMIRAMGDSFSEPVYGVKWVDAYQLRQSTTSIGTAHRMGVGECHTTYWFLIYSCTICKLFSLTVVTK